MNSTPSESITNATERVLMQCMAYVECAQDVLENADETSFRNLEREAEKLHALLGTVEISHGARASMMRDIAAIQQRLEAAQGRLKDRLRQMPAQAAASKAYRKKQDS